MSSTTDTPQPKEDLPFTMPNKEFRTKVKASLNAQPKETLRDIIGCTCAYNERYNGKSWNNKTQEYESCECVDKIPALNTYYSQLVDEIIGKSQNVFGNKDWTAKEIIARNKLQQEQRKRKQQLGLV